MVDRIRTLEEENARLREEVETLRWRLQPQDSVPLPSEQVYRSIFRLSPSIITVTRFEDGTYYDVNDSFCRLIGVTREQARETSSLGLGLWMDLEEREKVKTQLERDGSYTNIEIGYRVGDRTVTVLQSAELVTIGPSRYIIAISTDITQRKEAEASLAREREHLSVTLESLSDGVLGTDAGGCVETMNRVAAELLEVQVSEVRGRPLASVITLLDGNTRRPLSESVESLGRGGEQSKPHLLVGKRGTERWVSVDGADITSTQGEVVGTVLVLRDVTVRLQMEEQLRKASRLEALGVLAGGIAHDFNNLLMGIQSNVTFVRSRGVEEEERLEALEDVETAIRHAGELTRQLLTFSRGGAPIKSNASVAELLEDAVSFTLRGSNVRFSIETDEDLAAAEVDRSQISQAIENLVVNAHQAMPAGGSLRVEARNEQVGPESNLALQPGRYLRLTFADDGPGIPDADLPRIFDPFFSKRPGGTGLGLAIVHSVITRHGGCVNVQSQLGKGTRFDLYIRASDRAPDVADAKASAARPGNEKLLLMDDNPAIRRAMQRVLSRHGYEVDVVEDGDAALSAYRRATAEGAPYALVLLDLTVPGGTGGKETARRLREVDPSALIVISSGYSDDAAMADPRGHGFDGCITKPYDMEELGVLLRALLDG